MNSHFEINANELHVKYSTKAHVNDRPIDKIVCKFLDQLPSDNTRIDALLSIPNEIIQRVDMNIDILDRFYFAKTPAEADEVVNAFKKKFGSLMLCTGLTYSNRKFYTILDCLKQDLDDGWIWYPDVTFEGIRMFSDAFIRAGFKFAAECDHYELLLSYMENYDPDEFTNLQYEYPKLKTNRFQLHDDLFKELYHPHRIIKFIESGNELEDYLV